MSSYVEVWRGGLLESRHRVHAVAVNAMGQSRAYTGDRDLITFFRSAAKPFQAMPLVVDPHVQRLALSGSELALCCGSHGGTPEHVRVATDILRRAGCDRNDLACGPHPPLDAAARRELAAAGLEPTALHNNCSGKHAGMLALARARGWSTEGYQRSEHPVQRRALTSVADWTGMACEAIAIGNDGCGVACFGLPLRNMAWAYARLAAAARRGEEPARTIVGAMVGFPQLVAGEGRICTDLMRRTDGRVVAKVGAEGMYCLGVVGAELGVALKIEDGARRAIAPAVLAFLRELHLVSEDDLGALHEHAFPLVRNTRGEIVGQIKVSLHLESLRG